MFSSMTLDYVPSTKSLDDTDDIVFLGPLCSTQQYKYLAGDTNFHRRKTLLNYPPLISGGTVHDNAGKAWQEAGHDTETNNRAAVQIQRCFRGWSCRRAFRSKRNAAICIQRVTRGWLCRKQEDRRRRAAIVLQQLVRCHLCRRDFLITRKTTIQLQSLIRRSSLRRKFLATRRAVILIQSYVRAWLCRRRYAEQRRKVLLAQKWIRGSICKRRYATTRRAALTIQAAARNWLLRRKQQTAVLEIQRIVRGWIARRRYNELRSAVHLIQMRRKGVIERTAYLRCQASASTIQSWFRSVVARRHFLRKRNAALYIQKWWRQVKVTVTERPARESEIQNSTEVDIRAQRRATIAAALQLIRDKKRKLQAQMENTGQNPTPDVIKSPDTATNTTRDPSPNQNSHSITPIDDPFTDTTHLSALSPATLDRVTRDNNVKNAGYKCRLSFTVVKRPPPVSPTSRLKQRIEDRHKSGEPWELRGGEEDMWDSSENSKTRRLQWRHNLVSFVEFDPKEKVAAVSGSERPPSAPQRLSLKPSICSEPHPYEAIPSPELKKVEVMIERFVSPSPPRKPKGKTRGGSSPGRGRGGKRLSVGKPQRVKK
ncbi:uncharacterized protein SPPG_01850 [Spizellomyces punctatus DAOM BR117]|uniref:Uncharacterized protein n=1 Tax=Spizellomyces punctatus (strain DAOM BR117) TaxID=645134 RepID=A0A0L0HNY6_SPIPD|nr:uncharacterized protein SPPG_01850 [Spizellomyces punctatus DAOM BR117]KND02768.1 hypothetical protein SPPG_01850 [Spizellomyces punctatus DAOM BR117]|eukprot:XP_016610807.1 hypothetical protein SPPG_01850 [Spizellomyces punctatus DAOM BR117]